MVESNVTWSTSAGSNEVVCYLVLSNVVGSKVITLL